MIATKIIKFYYPTRNRTNRKTAQIYIRIFKMSKSNDLLVLLNIQFFRFALYEGGIDF